MRSFTAALVPMLLLIQSAAAVPLAANPSTGDHNVVKYAAIAMVVVVILAVFVLFRGKRK